jgi:hypothetical protein
MGLAGSVSTVGGSAVGACDLPREPTEVAVRAETADTLVLASAAVVKLVGALPPDAVVPVDPAGQGPDDLTRLALTGLAVGAVIDVGTVGRKSDRHGRTVAQAYVGAGAARTWIQGQLVADGLARAYALPGHVACLDDLLRREAEARDGARGHWGTGVFLVRQAADVRRLVRLAGTFQIVTGRVDRVEGRRSGSALVFDGDGGNWAEAILEPGDGVDGRRMRRSSRAELARHVGRHVRVRGWVERQSGGVVIRLADPREIEVVATPTAPPQDPTGRPWFRWRSATGRGRRCHDRADHTGQPVLECVRARSARSRPADTGSRPA